MYPYVYLYVYVYVHVYVYVYVYIYVYVYVRTCMLPNVIVVPETVRIVTVNVVRILRIRGAVVTRKVTREFTYMRVCPCATRNTLRT